MNLVRFPTIPRQRALYFVYKVNEVEAVVYDSERVFKDFTELMDYLLLELVTRKKDEKVTTDLEKRAQ